MCFFGLWPCSCCFTPEAFGARPKHLGQTVVCFWAVGCRWPEAKQETNTPNSQEILQVCLDASIICLGISAGFFSLKPLGLWDVRAYPVVFVHSCIAFEIHEGASFFRWGRDVLPHTWVHISFSTLFDYLYCFVFVCCANRRLWHIARLKRLSLKLGWIFIWLWARSSYPPTAPTKQPWASTTRGYPQVQHLQSLFCLAYQVERPQFPLETKEVITLNTFKASRNFLF